MEQSDIAQLYMKMKFIFHIMGKAIGLHIQVMGYLT